MKKLQNKILLSFIVILLLLAGLGGISYYNLYQSNKNVETMISNDLELLVASENFTQNIAERISSVRAYLLYNRSTYRMQYMDLSENASELSEELLNSGKRTGHIAEIEELLEQTNSWSTYIEDTVLPSIVSGNTDVAHQQLLQAEVTAVQLMHRFKQLSEENQATIKETGNSILAGAKQTENIIFITVISSLILGMLIAFLSARGIVKPIVQVVNRLERVSQGDLSGEVLKTKAKDELGTLVKSTNAMVKSLRTLVMKTNESSEQIAASAEELTASAEQTSNATEQIAASSEQMAASAETQLTSVNESAVTINQISAGIQQIAANSESVSLLASEASQSSHDGAETVHEVVDQMQSIETTVKETSTVIATLGERSKEIGNIVTMITDISDQTSLLALNAAIEAARAGDAGRGFAVVADEVRKLAEQSAQSATQITDLIYRIQEETTVAVQSMEEGTEKTADGLAKTNQLSEVFQKIERAVQDVEAKVQEVSAAAEQIATGSNQMVSGINVVKEAAETNAQASQENAAASEEQLAMMEEITTSAQALTKLADDMADVVKAFKL